MTTGTVTQDNRSIFTGNAGTFRVGNTYKRTWNGADGTITKPAKVWIPPYQSALLDRFGKPIVIPGYFKRTYDPRVRKAQTPHNYTTVRQRACTGRYDEKIGVTWYQYVYGDSGVTPNYGEASYSLPSNINWDSSDDLVLINKLRKRMVGSGFDPALFLVQADQTLGMLFQTASRIDKAFRFIRRGKLSDAAKALTNGTTTNRRSHRDFSPRGLTAENVASAQLELSYGWLPLMGDAYSGAQYTAHLTQLPMRLEYKVRRHRRVLCGHMSPTLWAFKSQDCRVFGQLIAQMQEDFAFSSTYLLGLDDPLGMVWERLPWSFVADWFCPIQTYLQDRAFARQVKGTFVKTTGYDLDLQGLKPFDTSQRRIPPGDLNTYRMIKLNMTRAVSTTLAVPFPKPASLLSVPSWGRALNATSLLVQRFGAGSAANALIGALAIPTGLVVVGKSLERAADDIASAVS